MTWGLRKKFQDGKFSVGYSRFLGYDKGEDGNLAINEEQAKTVRLIFRLFLEGMTACRIAKELTARHILTVTGKTKWNAAISAKEAQAERLSMFERTLKAQTEPVAEFDSQLWASMVECVTVGVDKGLTVVFRDGLSLSM